MIFASRCLIGRRNSGNLSAPDLVILRRALFHDTTFSLGAIVAKRLILKRTKGPIFGGIFASCLAKHFEIPIRHYEKEEKLLPTIFLDYKSMVAHDFIVKNNKKMLKYNLIFAKTHCETITLPAPSLFNNFQARTTTCPRPFMHTGIWHKFESQSQSHHLTHIDSLIISGIRRSSLTSGTLRNLLGTPERITLTHGHIPT